MPLNPHDVYKLTDKSNNYIYSSCIALGVKPTKQAHLGDDGEIEEVSGVIFMTNTEKGHYILGEPKDTEEGVQIVDAVRVGDDGKPVVWEFTPLTMASFDDMGPTLVGYANVRKAISDLATLHTFLIENFVPDDWLDDLKEGSPSP